MEAADFWQNQERAQPIVTELKSLKAQTEPIEKILREIDDVKALYELGAEAGHEPSIEEAEKQLATIEKPSASLEIQSLLNGPNDPRNAFFSIQSGQGGTEA